MAQIDERSRALLEAPNYCHVATLMRDGSPHVTTVWVDVDGDTVLLNTARGRVWPTNLDRDGRVALTVPDRETHHEYVEIRGRVVERTTEGADAHIDKLSKKYMGVDSYPARTPKEERVIYRIAPERVRYWGG